jgi:hypothetical protein
MSDHVIGLLWTAGCAGLTLGLLLGSWMRERRWRDAAGEPMRVESGGRLFHVVEHGDAAKALEVTEWAVRERNAATLNHRFDEGKS